MCAIGPPKELRPSLVKAHRTSIGDPGRSSSSAPFAFPVGWLIPVLNRAPRRLEVTLALAIPDEMGTVSKAGRKPISLSFPSGTSVPSNPLTLAICAPDRRQRFQTGADNDGEPA